uniref:Uncharacterized protein n=1 Tax=Alexandrium catenella TaxID=2925 RepID=A0A7S1S3C6_ALECA
MMYSPVIRRLQEASRFYFRGLKPPGMLYVTDGGVQDCTALMQLMRRRVERILLVLAASDPGDDLGVLRTAMDVAVASKLGCFYDPRDPRRDVKILLDEFKKDLHMPYLHLGIRYGWDGPSTSESFGRLIIVKNRLQEGFGQQPVRPLLTEEEIRGEQDMARPTLGKGKWGDMLEEDLGGYGCCDCCHTHCGNAGRKFPHLSFTGYMYLTPQLFSSLSRLGHDLSEAAIQAVTSPGRCG